MRRRGLPDDRLSERWGAVRPSTLAAVEDCLRILIGL
jgi:hypothetical protein